MMMKEREEIMADKKKRHDDYLLVQHRKIFMKGSKSSKITNIYTIYEFLYICYVCLYMLLIFIYKNKYTYELLLLVYA